MTPYLADPDCTLYHGDALETLRGLTDGCVDMVATSPPFYGLRDYGTGTWEGGDEGCDHKRFETRAPNERKSSTLGGGVETVRIQEEAFAVYKDECGKCGARRVDRQIGLEETPDQWVQNLVAVFRECRRVLADHGVMFVEIGDSYANTEHGRNDTQKMYGEEWTQRDRKDRRRAFPPNLKQKDLLGQPWMLAFALRADGWWLRSEIIWARPNPMPESVTDRPTKSHSTVFLLSKQPRYYFDRDAIREQYAEPQGGRAYRRYPEGFKEDASGNGRSGRLQGPAPGQISGPQVETLDGSDGEAPRGPDGRRVTAVKGAENSEQHRDGERWPNPSGANARSVWQIATEPTPFAHFATWPRKLVARMVQAGTSERGKCPVCGKPWVRDTETTYAEGGAGGAAGGRGDASEYVGKHGSRTTAMYDQRRTRVERTLGWSPSCSHVEGCGECDSCTSCAGEGVTPLDPVPCTVLDPFAGSGTTLLVARHHGRHSIGIELNQTYCKLAADRLSQLSLLAETNA